MTTIGSGDLSFEIVSNWAKLPDDWDAPMAAVTVDSQDRVYGFNRGERGVIVFDTDGNYQSHWADAEFAFPHAIYADPSDNIWIVDRDAGQVLKYSTDGDLLMSIGERGFRSDTGADNSVLGSNGWVDVTHGGEPFNLPAGVAVAPNGDIFVADGYANCRVHKFTSEGEHLKSWGDPGQWRWTVQPAARRVYRPQWPSTGGRPRERPRSGVRPGRRIRRTVALRIDRPSRSLDGLQRPRVRCRTQRRLLQHPGL